MRIALSFFLRNKIKLNGSNIVFALMRKKFFFACFRIDAKERNLKRNENERKRKENEKEAKTAVNFASKRNEAKRKRNFVSLRCEKSAFFACFRI